MQSKCEVSDTPGCSLLTLFPSHDDPSAEFTPRERKRKNKAPKVEVESSTDADKAEDSL